MEAKEGLVTDDALIAWLSEGALPKLTAEEEGARRCAGFVQRFAEALAAEDLGATQELHDAAVAALVHEVHADLSSYGIEVYDDVWRLLSAPVRASIKRYLTLYKEIQ